MLTREWFSPAELAAMTLPGMPTTKPNVISMAERLGWQKTEWLGKRWRQRAGRGGGVEYHYSVLPHAAQIKVAVDFAAVEQADERAAAKQQRTREEMWRWFDALPDSKKAEAQHKLEVLDALGALMRSGLRKTFAAQQVAAKFGVTLATLYNWEKAVYGIDRHDWLPFLAPRHAGRTETVECDPEAWEMLKADYLRPERPTFEACHRRLRDTAKERGWTIPSARTLLRRIDALPEALRVLARDGAEALARMYPPQRRDRSVFHALEAVNADGHKWDVFVKWPDGYVGRPMMVAFQDLYSGMILSWRVDRSENREAIRLAFGDMVEQFGIPDHCTLDNGRGFTSKWLTGGTPNRYRFKVKDDEPSGIMTQLGVEIHWAQPFHGQSKPIERAFGDFAKDTAKHPAFSGAYVGNKPDAKPENYGSAAVPLDRFLAILHKEITAHNVRDGRRTKTCDGRSFQATFEASYAESPIRKATAEQRRLWLLAAEAVGTHRDDGHIPLFGNRYWSDFLHAHRGEKLAVRFDPAKLRQPLHVYRLDGAYLGAAACLDDTGFNDIEAAAAHARAKRRWLKAEKEQLAAERTLTAAQVAAMLPAPAEPPPAPETKVVRLLTRGAAALAPAEHDEQDGIDREDRLFAAVGALNRAARDSRPGHLRIVDDAGD